MNDEQLYNILLEAGVIDEDTEEPLRSMSTARRNCFVEAAQMIEDAMPCPGDEG